MTVKFSFGPIIALGFLPMWSVLCAAETESLTQFCPATGPLLLKATGVVEILGDRVLASRAIGCVAPELPELARQASFSQAHFNGYVRVGVLVNEAGLVTCGHLINGHPLLAGSAIDAARQWIFRPATQNARAVSVYGVLAFHYSPSGGKERSCLDAHWAHTPVLRDIAPKSQPDSGSTVRTEPRLIRQTRPKYPEEAIVAHIEGVVHLWVVISKEGDIRKVGPISGYRVLLPAAIEAVKQWKYAPTLRNGTPVEVRTQVDVSFKLSQ